MIAFLVLWLSGRAFPAMLFTGAYSALAFALYQPGMVPKEMLWYGQAANIPMVVVGKFIQVDGKCRRQKHV